MLSGKGYFFRLIVYLVGIMATLSIQRKTHTNKRFFENLGDDIDLEMVLIPGGSFVMGSPEDELENYDDEQPQHFVTVPTFFMGRYPVTQKQWREVATNFAVSQVGTKGFELNAEPANFLGDERPVEQVSWHDAMEFCDRLRLRTGKNYQLPSEAQWEYACRAVSLEPKLHQGESEILATWNKTCHQPFHWGETITDQLANYRATTVYGRGLEGQYRGETTGVKEFNAPNAFGLCDMHGNVREWCADHWHSNYQGAPRDGRAWVEKESTEYVLRGGCWNSLPRDCRSAYRRSSTSGVRGSFIGFRVVFVP